MDTTPLDGYKKLSVTILTVLLSIILLFVHTQTTSDTLTNIFTQLENWIPALLGIVYTVVQGSVDKTKAANSGTTTTDAAAGSSPKANSAAVATVQPAVAPIVIQAAEVDPVYTPVDLDKYVATAEEGIRKDGQTVTDLTKAYYFYPMITRFDLRPIPRQNRISEGKRIVDKGIELFTNAFKFYSNLDNSPTPAQAANLNNYMLELRKAYEQKNNLTCTDSTFENLRNMVTYFDDLYTASYGLSQLLGKSVDWSIYGTGFIGPTQVGWDFAKLV